MENNIERFETLDAVAQRLSYRLLTATPFGSCLTNMVVRDLGRNRAELTWSASFEADGIAVSEAAELLEGALADNCLALRRFMEDGRW